MEREIAELYLKFQKTAGIGPATFAKLIRHFGSIRKIKEANEYELRKFLSPVIVEELFERMNKEDPEVNREIDNLYRLGAELVVYESENYPRLLREISSPPSVLYIRGKLLPGDERAIAVVGTRHPTPHGKSATEKICEELVRYGFTIISGLAQGIDSIAHRSALQAGGRTIGVLGCGIDRVYPASNAWLFHEVMMKGCLISEFPLGTPPNAYNFPKRNRIISGMALGTIIAEAGEKSGALITANYALEQNRELFAIPGPIDSEKSAGVNRLIEEGAIPVTSARIVAETLLPSIEPLYPTPVEMAKPVQELKEETPEYKPSSAEQKLLAILSKEPVHIDTIAERLGIPIKDVLSLLFAFELKGVVKQFPGKYFIKV